MDRAWPVTFLYVTELKKISQPATTLARPCLPTLTLKNYEPRRLAVSLAEFCYLFCKKMKKKEKKVEKTTGSSNF